MNVTRLAKVFASLACLFVCSIAGDARAEEVCRPCPFDCGGIGASRDHCSSRGSSNGQCCVDLDRRGEDALHDRDQINESNRQYGNQAYGNQGYNNQAYGGCPAGFSMRADKCSDSERAQGCHDVHPNNSNGSCVKFDNHVGSERAPGQGNYQHNRRH